MLFRRVSHTFPAFLSSVRPLGVRIDIIHYLSSF